MCSGIKPVRPRCGAYYSSSSSLGKWTVQSSSRRQMGRPRRMDIDLSAKSDVEQHKGRDVQGLCRTSEQQPESSASYFTFNEVKTFVR